MSAAAVLLAALAMASYPVVAHVGSVPVRAPAARASWGRCPGDTVARADLTGARRAVLAALPAIARLASPPLDTRGVRVEGVQRTLPVGFILPARRACQGTPFRHSVLVRLYLPLEAKRAADLRGNPWFYVARTPAAWVVWDEPH